MTTRARETTDSAIWRRKGPLDVGARASMERPYANGVAPGEEGALRVGRGEKAANASASTTKRRRADWRR